MTREAPLWARSAIELARALERGELRSVELVEAFQRRADEVEPIVGGFAARFREAALRDAERADAERRAGRARGPLHGLPLTVKENIDVAGVPTTLGLSRRRDRAAPGDAAVVRAARAAGMILLGKSNVPQGLVSGMECENPLFGATRNPHAPSHGPGGSSGGEAALLAAGATLLGIGTDLGGSIRSPAAYCGVVGLKPTSLRWSGLGVATFLPGQEIVRAQVGPMARSVADLELLFRELPLEPQRELDPEVPPRAAPARRERGVEGLRVGWYDDDGHFAAAPAHRRAVRDVREALRARGAELVALPPAFQAEWMALYVAAVSSDGLVTARGNLRGESIVGNLRELWWAARVPELARRALARGLSAAGERRLAATLEAARRRSVHEHWALADRRRQLRVDELARWREGRLEVVICPAAAVPPVPRGRSRGLATAFAYTARYNLAGFPAGVVPTTRVRPTDAPRSERRDRLDRLAAAVEERSVGLPVAVQVVGLPHQDERVLEVMAALEAWARVESDPVEVPITPRPAGGRQGG